MFWDGWTGLVRIAVVGSLAYLAVVVLLRVGGKRLLAKMNAFDLVVTVALGSTLSSAVLTENLSLAEGVLGLALLVTLQWAVAWFSSRIRSVRRAVKSEPALLLHHGEFLDEALLRERMPREEVRQAVRSQGFGDLDDIAAVVLETDGTLSVIARSKLGSGSALADLAAQPGGAPPRS